MSHTIYKQIVGLTPKQLDALRWKIYEARKNNWCDPRLEKGFYFYGRHFHNYACVERYMPDTQTLDVRIYVGTKGQSYVEYGWKAIDFIHGFEDCDYAPCGLIDDYEPIVPAREWHDHCPITTPVK